MHAQKSLRRRKKKFDVELTKDKNSDEWWNESKMPKICCFTCFSVLTHLESVSMELETVGALRASSTLTPPPSAFDVTCATIDFKVGSNKSYHCQFKRVTFVSLDFRACLDRQRAGGQKKKNKSFATIKSVRILGFPWRTVEQKNKISILHLGTVTRHPIKHLAQLPLFRMHIANSERG